MKRFHIFVLNYLCIFCCLKKGLISFDIGTFKFPGSLKEYCPMTTFCKPGKIYNTKPGYEPCCKSCSCQPDCKLTHNCCRDEFASSDYADYSSCVFSGVTKDKSFEDFGTNYWMIDKCPDPNLDCRYQPVAPWGSVYPVSSPTKKETYINSHCAYCHNATDVYAWTIVYVCPISSEFNNLGSFSFEDFLNGFRECSIEFQPRGTGSFKPETCRFQTTIACSKTVHDEELQQLCTLFNATFTYRSAGFRSVVFGNVYCFLCNIAKISKTYADECPSAPHTPDYKSKFKNALVSFIDYSFAKNLVSSHQATSDVLRQDNTQKVCGLAMDKRKDDCRPLLCPEGQYRLNGSQCHFNSQWKHVNIILLVKLSYSRPLKEISINCLNQDLESNKHFKLYVSGLKQYSYSMFYHPSVDFEHIEYLIAKLQWTNTEWVNPYEIVSEIKNALRKPWTIVACNKATEFDVQINDYLTYFSFGNDLSATKTMRFQCRNDIENFLPIWMKAHINVQEPCEFMPPLRLIPVQSGRHSINQIGDGLWLTKTFFCEQIELKENEYIAHQDRIYLAKSKTYLYDAEYRRVVNSDGREKIRTCVDQFIIRNLVSSGLDLRSYRPAYGLVCGLLHHLAIWSLGPCAFTCCNLFSSYI